MYEWSALIGPTYSDSYVKGSNHDDNAAALQVPRKYMGNSIQDKCRTPGDLGRKRFLERKRWQRAGGRGDDTRQENKVESLVNECPQYLQWPICFPLCISLCLYSPHTATTKAMIQPITSSSTRSKQSQLQQIHTVPHFEMNYHIS